MNARQITLLESQSNNVVRTAPTFSGELHPKRYTPVRFRKGPAFRPAIVPAKPAEDAGIASIPKRLLEVESESIFYCARSANGCDVRSLAWRVHRQRIPE